MNSHAKFRCLAALGLGAFLAIGALARAQDPSLVLYLPFDEGKGKTARDASGHGLDGQLKGKATWGDGKYGTAVRLDVNGFVEVPHDDVLNLTKAMTLMMWVQIRQDTGDQQSGIEKGPSWGPGEYNLLPDYNNQVLLQANDLPDNCDDELQGGDVMDGEWHHIVGTWDGKEIRLYVDGEQVQKGPCAGELDTNKGSLYIGARGGAQRWTMGSYDEIKIFNRALSKKEVQAEMTFEESRAVDPRGRLATTWGALRSIRADF